MTHGATSFEAGGHGGSNSERTQHYAGAERVTPDEEDPFTDTDGMIRGNGSKEYILPKLPKEGVYVRRDVMVDFS